MVDQLIAWLTAVADWAYRGIDFCVRQPPATAFCGVVGVDTILTLAAAAGLRLRHGVPLGVPDLHQLRVYAGVAVGLLIVLSQVPPDSGQWLTYPAAILLALGIGHRHGSDLSTLAGIDWRFAGSSSAPWRMTAKYFLGSELRYGRYTGLLWYVAGIGLLSGSLVRTAAGLLATMAGCVAFTYGRGDSMASRVTPVSSLVLRLRWVAPPAHFALWSALVTAAAALAGTATSALDLVETNSASESLAALIGAQAIFGLLPLTVVMVVVEASSAVYASRLVQRIAGTLEAWLATGALFLSVVFGAWVIAHPSTHAGPLPDVAFVVAVLTTVTAVGTATRLFRLVSPQHLMARVLTGLDHQWFRRVCREFGPRRFRWRDAADDPFRDIERLLDSILRRNDRHAFEDISHMLTDHLIKEFSSNEFRETLEYFGLAPEAESALDAYLAEQLSELISTAGETRQEWALNELIATRMRIRPLLLRHPSAPQHDRTLEHGYPPIDLDRARSSDQGLHPHLCLARILEVAIDAGIEGSGSRVGLALARELERALANCPRERSWAWEQPGLVTRGSSEEDARRWQDDQYPALIYMDFFNHVKSQAIRAVERRLPETARSLASALGEIFESAPALTSDDRLVEIVSRTVASDLEEVALAAAEMRLGRVLVWPGDTVHGARGQQFLDLQAEILVTLGEATLPHLAESGVLDPLLVEMAAISMVQLSQAQRPAVAARLAATLHSCAEHLSAEEQLRRRAQARRMRTEIYNRIAQARTAAGASRTEFDAQLKITCPPDTHGEQLAEAIRAGAPSH